MTHGALTSPKDVRNYRMVSTSPIGDLPTTYEIQNMTDVKNQGFYSACVAYALAIIAEWHCRRYGDETADLSPFYNYGNRRYTTWTGMGLYPCDALKTAVKCGFVTTKDFPYKGEIPSITADFERQFNEIFDKGIPNRFSAYYRVNTESEIKQSLMVHGPLLASVEWYHDMTVKNGVIQTKYAKKSGSHAVVIYGWNEIGWLIQNSWGDSWGVNGRAVLPYDIPIEEAWGIIDEISENRRKQEIDSLTMKNTELTANVEKLMGEIFDLNEKIKDFNTTEEEYFHLSDELADCRGELAKALDALDDQKAETERLKAENIELKKPFSSPFGKIVAKFLNKILNFLGSVRK